MTQVESIWTNPKVQEKATQAQDFAKAKAPVVKGGAASAAAAAKDKVGGSDDTTSTFPTSASTGTV